MSIRRPDVSVTTALITRKQNERAKIVTQIISSLLPEPCRNASHESKSSFALFASLQE